MKTISFAVLFLIIALTSVEAKKKIALNETIYKACQKLAVKRRGSSLWSDAIPTAGRICSQLFEKVNPQLSSQNDESWSFSISFDDEGYPVAFPPLDDEDQHWDFSISFDEDQHTFARRKRGRNFNARDERFVALPPAKRFASKGSTRVDEDEGPWDLTRRSFILRPFARKAGRKLSRKGRKISRKSLDASNEDLYYGFLNLLSEDQNIRYRRFSNDDSTSILYRFDAEEDAIRTYPMHIHDDEDSQVIAYYPDEDNFGIERRAFFPDEDQRFFQGVNTKFKDEDATPVWVEDYDDARFKNGDDERFNAGLAKKIRNDDYVDASRTFPKRFDEDATPVWVEDYDDARFKNVDDISSVLNRAQSVSDDASFLGATLPYIDDQHREAVRKMYVRLRGKFGRPASGEEDQTPVWVEDYDMMAPVRYLSDEDMLSPAILKRRRNSMLPKFPRFEHPALTSQPEITEYAPLDLKVDGKKLRKPKRKFGNKRRPSAHKRQIGHKRRAIKNSDSDMFAPELPNLFEHRPLPSVCILKYGICYNF